MLRSVFARTWRDQRRGLIGWAIGIAAYAAMILAIYPSIHGRADDFEKLVANYPSAIKALFNVNDFTTPAGYLRAELLSFIAPFLLVLYAVSHGSAATASEEETHTIDVLLATPVSRGQVVVAKFAAVAAGVATLSAVLFASILAMAPVVDLRIGVGSLAAAVAGIMVFALVTAALSLLFGSLTGHRALARGLAAVVTLGAYLVSSLAPLASWLRPLRSFSPYYHAIGRSPLQYGGLRWGWSGVLVVSVGCLVALASVVFERRDLTA